MGSSKPLWESRGLVARALASLRMPLPPLRRMERRRKALPSFSLNVYKTY